MKKETGRDEAPRFSPASLHLERQPGRDGVARVTQARHPAEAFERIVAPKSEAGFAAALFRFAADYLTELAPHVGAELERLLPQLQSPPPDEVKEPVFGWLRIGWPDEPRDPRGSFRVQRFRSVGKDGGGSGLLDQTVVLMAGNVTTESGWTGPQGCSIGLRVPVHVSPLPDGASRLRIDGFSASNLHEAYGTKLHITLVPPRNYLPVIAMALNVVDGALAATGYRTTLDDRIEFELSVGNGSVAGSRRVERVSVTLTPTSDTDGRLTFGPRIEQVTHALSSGLPSEAATLDLPATAGLRRPGNSAALQRTRRPLRHRPPKKGGGFELRSKWFEVRQSPLSVPAGDPKDVHVVPAGDRPLCSDDLSALHAFQRGAELVERFTAYGLDPSAYFRAIRTPVVIRHRSAFSGRRDGKAVNAQVRISSIGPGVATPYVPSQWPEAEILFGAAHLAHRDRPRRGKAGDKPPSAQPLGLAADPRWAWHEFGHLLMLASTDELEFRFAHSVGDALAAIVADPLSRFAHLPATSTFARGLTFPWVAAPRRHDREAAQGWCWCGRINRRRGLVTQQPPRLFTHYVEEQLLSSSLFRLYRALGGDSRLRRVRQAASDYCVYLVMRGLSLLGPASLTPATSPDQLVTALIQADTHTAGPWEIKAPWGPATAPIRKLRRTGGTAQKVIRWAFQQQGLYATSSPTDVVEGPGKPPPVDLYLQARGRAAAGYDPVELAWNGKDPNRPWHASTIAVSGGRIEATVSNAGDADAIGLQARAWISHPVGPFQWAPLQALAPVPADLAARASATLTFQWPAGATGPRVVVVEVGCAADPSLLSAIPWLPAANASPPQRLEDLIELVSGDNNLGLAVLSP